MPALDLSEEILETLSEAAVEIANLSSPDNIVCRRLRALQRKLAPRSVTIREIAERIDVAPRDVLDAAIAAGVQPFWHEGQQFRDAAYLRTYLRLQFLFDPVRELEFNLSPDLAERLADELNVTPEELLTDTADSASKPATGPRKFVASDSRYPQPATAEKRRDQTG
jgi:hypothetical protein